jgi:hypothetical protein
MISFSRISDVTYQDTRPLIPHASTHAPRLAYFSHDTSSYNIFFLLALRACIYTIIKELKMILFSYLLLYIFIFLFLWRCISFFFLSFFSFCESRHNKHNNKTLKIENINDFSQPVYTKESLLIRARNTQGNKNERGKGKKRMEMISLKHAIILMFSISSVLYCFSIKTITKANKRHILCKFITSYVILIAAKVVLWIKDIIFFSLGFCHDDTSAFYNMHVVFWSQKKLYIMRE